MHWRVNPGGLLPMHTNDFRGLAHLPIYKLPVPPQPFLPRSAHLNSAVYNVYSLHHTTVWLMLF